ncbi:unnamed protein product [Oppiella nova]|uniref:Histone deacetylase domain-containing protein n=1 Tax=Oppiella nova TaxID=334625 RepID=A0A7R9MDI5_9ACAR|nr:unnamed protein product [Oppiella nova]CAG2175361.1 unnamed protein product [Oppiella nova]
MRNTMISSAHSLHSYKTCDNKPFIPIVYRNDYDIYFFKIENIHPFDTKKWGKIAHNLRQYFQTKYGDHSGNDFFISPSHSITKDELSLVHTKGFICRMHCSPLSVARAAEVCPLILCPICIIERKLLQPIKWQTSGSILAAFLALKYGWAINLGGGFHHCSANRAQGFCLFADITLTIRYLWQEVRPELNVLIVDCDAHEGNGYARDVLAMVYILDLFNPYIFPDDEKAQTAINRAIHLRPRIEDTDHIKATLTDDHFMPDLIIYNAGTDILSGDPLGRLRISPNGIAKRDEIVFRYAKENDISIVMLLSGGYQRNNAEVIANSIRNLFDNHFIDAIK